MTVSPEGAVTQHSGVPWWIILVAVLAGILILALLVFLLWKVGMLQLPVTHEMKYNGKHIKQTLLNPLGHLGQKMCCLWMVKDKTL